MTKKLSEYQRLITFALLCSYIYAANTTSALQILKIAWGSTRFRAWIAVFLTPTFLCLRLKAGAIHLQTLAVAGNLLWTTSIVLWLIAIDFECAQVMRAVPDSSLRTDLPPSLMNYGGSAALPRLDTWTPSTWWSFKSSFLPETVLYYYTHFWRNLDHQTADFLSRYNTDHVI